MRWTSFLFLAEASVYICAPPSVHLWSRESLPEFARQSRQSPGHTPADMTVCISN